MLRLDSRVIVMVATKEQWEAIESALGRGPLVLFAPDDELRGASFKVVILDESERYIDQAEEILG